MDDLHYQEHLHLLISRVRDALAAARAQSGAGTSEQASRLTALLRTKASLERKLADYQAALTRIESEGAAEPASAILADDQPLEEKRRQYQILEDEISRTRGKLPQLRADLTMAAFHALAEPSEFQRKQSELDALVQKIALWSARRDSLARQLSRQEG